MTPWAPKTHQQTIKEQRRGGLDTRPSACKRGYGRAHRRRREYVLRCDSVCMKYHKEPSTDADHIVPLSKGGKDNVSNMQGLCASCHSQKTATEDGGFGN